MKDRIKLLLKLSLVAGLFYLLVQKGFISLHETSRAFREWQKVVPALAALICSTLLAVFRWQWLLQAQGIRLPLRRTFQLVFVGCFFNIALPGAVSGDFVKAYYIGKEAGGQRARAFGSILFDRVAGLGALALVSAGSLLLGFRGLVHTPVFGALKLVILVSAACVIVGFGYLFLVSERHDPVLNLFRKLESRYTKAGSLTRIYEGLRHYHLHRWTVVRVMIVSIMMHLLVGAACYLFAQALGQTQIELLPVYVIVPIGLLITAIPVLPAGVGTGHAAFLSLFKLIGSERGADVFTFFALSQIFVGALGGIVYLQFRAKSPAPSFEPTA